MHLVRDARETGDDHLLHPDAFQRRFGGTAVTRAGRQGLSRNAAIALGNRAAPGDDEALAECLTREPDPVVRAHAAWGLGAIASDAAVDALYSRLSTEREDSVRREIQRAIEVVNSRK